MSYLSELRHKNSRVKELIEEFQRYSKNENLFNILKEDNLLAQRKYDALTEKWENEYIPAIEKRQQLKYELYLAKTRPETFSLMISQELNGLSSKEIEILIGKMEKSSKLPTVNPFTNEFTEESECSDHQHQPNSIFIEIPNLRYSEDKTEIDLKKLRQKSWTVYSVDQKLKTLEETHLEITGRKRALGNRTCELTAKLHIIYEKVNALETAMRFSKESFYSAVEAELRVYRLQFSKTFLENRLKTSEQSRAKSFYALVSSRDVSTDTDITDLSQLGNDFLQSTNESLHEVTSKYMNK